MSKMDGLRAMREARYQAAAGRSPKPASSPAPAAKPAPKSATPPMSAPKQEDPSPALCGHRAISGRTCTRELGHASKSHRYS